ncbi:hypothetical protein [Prosthecobacter fusiformis]|uniref:hypothetical protein n=1 Tax=Prosthecobacter fusiformis TaxID=48464 RepID=UPI00105D1E9C|nr:hypothetical protein [Prosthecobacter fusiformis]
MNIPENKVMEAAFSKSLPKASSLIYKPDALSLISRLAFTQQLNDSLGSAVIFISAGGEFSAEQIGNKSVFMNFLSAANIPSHTVPRAGMITLIELLQPSFDTSKVFFSSSFQ